MFNLVSTTIFILKVYKHIDTKLENINNTGKLIDEERLLLRCKIFAW